MANLTARQQARLAALLEALRKDYDHPWPGEDIATGLHRCALLEWIEETQKDVAAVMSEKGSSPCPIPAL